MNRKELWGELGFALLTILLLSFTIGAQSPKGDASLSEKARKGKEIFNDRCHICHDVDSERVKPLGPTLNGLYKREKLAVGKPVTDANVKEVIKMGPTPGMPAFRYTLSDPEIDDLIEFLKTK